MLLGCLRRYGNAFIVMSPTSLSCRRRPRRDKKVELCSTFENVPNAAPSCPRRCGDSFLNGNHKFVISDDGVAQFFTWRFIIMHSRLKITLSNYKNSPPTISLGHVPVANDDMETTSS